MGHCQLLQVNERPSKCFQTSLMKCTVLPVCTCLLLSWGSQQCMYTVVSLRWSHPRLAVNDFATTTEMRSWKSHFSVIGPTLPPPQQSPDDCSCQAHSLASQAASVRCLSWAIVETESRAALLDRTANHFFNLLLGDLGIAHDGLVAFLVDGACLGGCWGRSLGGRSSGGCANGRLLGSVHLAIACWGSWVVCRRLRRGVACIHVNIVDASAMSQLCVGMTSPLALLC